MSVVGRVLLIPRGSWTSTDVYNRLDWVRYNGIAWVCKQNNVIGIVPSLTAPEWQLLAQDGTVGGWSSITNKPFNTIGTGLMVNSSDELTVAKDLVTDKTTVQALNELLTGTGTAGYDAGEGASPRYFPAKFIYNTTLASIVDGDMLTIKIPVAGSDYGVYVSIDDGSTYHPVALKETTKLSTEFGVGSYITLIYDAIGSVSDIYPVSGGDTPGTVAGGAFKVLNFSAISTSTLYDVNDPAETDIDDADYFPFYDTSATTKKKSLWSNIKDKLSAIFTLLSIVGTVENGETASRAYAVGEHFVKDGYFCTAITAIAQGATLTLNTNYTQGDIANAINIRQPLNTYVGYIAVGTSTTITVSGGYRGLLVGIGNGNMASFVFGIYTNNSGTISVNEIDKGDSISYTSSSGGRITITNSSSGSHNTYVYDLTFQGSVIS